MPKKSARNVKPGTAPPPLPPLPVIMAGPCVIETEDNALRIAREMAGLCAAHGFPYIFKASFDKANRSSLDSYRGPGLKDGLAILKRIKKATSCRLITDIHEPAQAAPAARVVDVLQIPAFLCRQTDLLVAAATTGRTVSVKKGQFLAPNDIAPLVNKLRASGCDDFYITERGTTFGYNNLVVDMRALALMRAQGVRVIFDATHSVQRPGGRGTTSGGDGALAPVLTRAALAVGIDGLFFETHPHPARALSDGPNMIPLAQVDAHLRNWKAIHQAAHGAATDTDS